MIVLDLSQEQLAAVSNTSANAVGTNNILSDIIEASGIVANEETEILLDSVAEEITPGVCTEVAEPTDSTDATEDASSTPDLCSTDAEPSTRLTSKYCVVNSSSNQTGDGNDEYSNNSIGIARPQFTNHKQLDDSKGKQNLFVCYLSLPTIFNIN